ncbi:MAG TPA: hypothetical protein GXZ62_06760 [Lentisphaerae bacterium]|jgi:hypothetical protein|nr:hypothetical protein [Lentisphaerota bacterium]
MNRFFRLVAGLALIPLCVAMTLALLDLLRGLAGGLFSPEVLWLGIGYTLWLVLWFVMPQPARAYVMAHELTHALWALLFGARIRKMKVTAKGGSVSLSKTNLLITLAPYFFPFYTVLVLLLRWLVGCFVQPVPMPYVWLFLVGLTWGFHLRFTVQSLLTRQPDILEYGRILSHAVIYIFNLLGILLWLICTTSISLSAVVAALLVRTAAAYSAVVNLLVRAVAGVIKQFS